MNELAAADLPPSYMQHRAALADATAGDELLSRVRARETAAKPQQPGAAAAPATNPAQAAEEQQGGVVSRTAKDIGLGVIETPRAIVKGVRDAVQSTIDIGNEFNEWMKGTFPNNPLNAGVKWDGDGLHFMSVEDSKTTPEAQITVPDLGAPKSVTGGLVKGVAQFLTGMKGAGKILGKVTEAEGAAGYTAKALQGAIANFGAFDPHQQRLSNLVQQFPALQNPVSAFLASDPTDGAAEGRFKNALEGLGLGVATDGFFKAVKLLRQATFGKTAAEAAANSPEAVAAGAKPKIDESAFRLLGEETTDAKAPLVGVKPAEAPVAPGSPPAGTPEQIAAAAKTAKEEPGKVFINFARIDTPEDVKRAMQEMADLNAEGVSTAARGKQSFEQIKLNAEQKNAWKILSERRQGEPLNAEQSVAARQLWASSADRLTQLATVAASEPSEANLFAFRKMLSVHDSIQKEVIAARTETARALASWRIPVGSSAERFRDVAGALDAAGGSEVSRELASRVSALGRAGMTHEMGLVVEKGAYATTRDAVVEAWVNGLLSNPTTHAANILSNSSVMGLRIAERAVGSKISSVLGDESGVAAGEASAQYFGLTQGIRDAFRYALKTARTGDSGFGLGKLETQREGAITSAAFDLSNTGWLGRAVDMLGMVVRTPGRALQAEDEFFKTIGYRMELYAQAHRQALSEVSSGAIEEQGLSQRIAEIAANPPENIRMAAVDSATYQTFTNAPGKLAQSLQGLTSHYPALKLIMPFVRTPANILKFTFERTPLAPLMSSFRQSISAGGARRDLALAQVGLGSMVMMSAIDATMSGQLSGSGPAEKGTKATMMREGWQPYSVKVGNRWYAYNRLDPVGSMLGMSADIVDALRNAQHEALDDPDTEKLAVATSIAIAGNLINKTYLSGLSSVFEAMSDPQQYGEATIQRMVGSVVPAVVANGARLNDPYQRQVYSMLDAIKARTPGLSDSLQPRRNLWGEPLSYDSGLGNVYDAFSPVYTKPGKQEPIDEEMLRQESNVTMPGKRTNFDGVTVDLGQHPDAYSRYVELAGNELKHPAWKMGSKDLLNAVVSGNHPLSAVYNLRSDGPDGGKDVFIRDTIRQYRELARKQILTEFPTIAAEVRDKKAKQRELKLPVQN